MQTTLLSELPITLGDDIKLSFTLDLHHCAMPLLLQLEALCALPARSTGIAEHQT
jgi:hypothetical protein